jgi:hypothetical protein
LRYWYLQVRYSTFVETGGTGSTAETACVCPVGRTGPDGASTCSACLQGQFKGITGAASCIACDANSTAPAGSDGGDDCLCDVGFTGSLTGTTSLSGSCTLCGAGTFKDDAGVAACTACPGNSGTNGETGRTVCKCDAGYTGSDCNGCAPG